jgi:hypothetical protein
MWKYPAWRFQDILIVLTWGPSRRDEACSPTFPFSAIGQAEHVGSVHMKVHSGRKIVSPKFIRPNLLPMRRWVLFFWRWLSCEGTTLMNGIQGDPMSLLPCKDAASSHHLWIREPSQTSNPMHVELLSLQNCEQYLSSVYKSPNLGHFVIAIQTDLDSGYQALSSHSNKQGTSAHPVLQWNLHWLHLRLSNQGLWEWNPLSELLFLQLIGNFKNVGKIENFCCQGTLVDLTPSSSATLISHCLVRVDLSHQSVHNYSFSCPMLPFSATLITT